MPLPPISAENARALLVAKQNIDWLTTVVDFARDKKLYLVHSAALDERRGAVIAFWDLAKAAAVSSESHTAIVEHAQRTLDDQAQLARQVDEWMTR